MGLVLAGGRVLFTASSRSASGTAVPVVPHASVARAYGALTDLLQLTARGCRFAPSVALASRGEIYHMYVPITVFGFLLASQYIYI